MTIICSDGCIKTSRVTYDSSHRLCHSDPTSLKAIIIVQFMGTVVTTAPALAGAVSSVINVSNAALSSAASVGIASDPAMKELEDRAEREKERAEEAEWARKHAEGAMRKAEEDKAAAEEQTRLLNEQIKEMQKGIAEGIKPIISPTLEEMKARIEYKDVIFHFAVGEEFTVLG